MKKLLAVLCAVCVSITISACGKDMSTDGGQPVISKAQQDLDTAKSIARKADFGLYFYTALTPCAETTAKLCYDPGIAAEVAKTLATLNAAIDVGQLALNGGAGLATDEKIKAAIAAGVAVLKAAQKYGIA